MNEVRDNLFEVMKTSALMMKVLFGKYPDPETVKESAEQFGKELCLDSTDIEWLYEGVVIWIALQIADGIGKEHE